jgi:glycosyltransferase involved in cell wall biosynthesis
MSQKLFEVFLGTYNAAPWIEKVIHSLEAQDCEPFTVKIVDNDSEDQTIEIIEKLFSKYSFRNQYQLIKNRKNIGAISTFLDRLDLFDAEWIVMIHQDDYYHPDHISSLIEEISVASETTGLVFSAMKRIDANDTEIFVPPTLSSKVSSTDRFENFLTAIQINPINFPACTLRKSILSKIHTTRHTTAFNDTEMLIRMMCISDFIYTKKETMHYRIHSGNAMSITKSKSEDRAVLIGFNEIFHSTEFRSLIPFIDTPEKSKKLINALKSAIEIRILDPETKNMALTITAESLVRLFGYSNDEINNFLIESLEKSQLEFEIKTVRNLKDSSEFELNDFLNGNKLGPNFFSSSAGFKLNSGSLFSKTSTAIPLKSRENILNLIFKSPIFILFNRPFVQVWRKRGKSD